MNVLYLFQVVFIGISIAVYLSFNMPHKEKIILTLFGLFVFLNHKFTPLCYVRTSFVLWDTVFNYIICDIYEVFLVPELSAGHYACLGYQI